MGNLPHQSNLRKGRYSQPHGLYFITKCLKTGRILSPNQRSVAVAVLRRLQERSWLLLQAFAIMPDHLHLLFSLGKDKSLSLVVREFCRITSNDAGTFEEPIEWQKGYFDHKIRPEESILGIVRYIEGNPVRKKLVATAAEWSSSSANTEHDLINNRSMLGHERWADK